VSARVTEVSRTGAADRTVESLEGRSFARAVTTDFNLVHDRLRQGVFDSVVELDIGAEVICSGIQARLCGFSLLLAAGTVRQTTVEDVRKLLSIFSRFKKIVGVEVADLKYARQLLPSGASGSALVE
jgi:hypothetical protein